MINLTEKQALEIIDETVQNGGYTHKQEEGKRYVVARGICEVVTKKLTVEILLKYVEIANTHNSSFGTWFNTENDKFYLDLSDLYNDEKEALKIAKKRNEIAIYDLLENKEIKVQY